MENLNTVAGKLFAANAKATRANIPAQFKVAEVKALIKQFAKIRSKRAANQPFIFKPQSLKQRVLSLFPDKKFNAFAKSFSNVDYVLYTDVAVYVSGVPVGHYNNGAPLDKTQHYTQLKLKLTASEAAKTFIIDGYLFTITDKIDKNVSACFWYREPDNSRGDLIKVAGYITTSGENFNAKSDIEAKQFAAKFEKENAKLK